VKQSRFKIFSDPVHGFISVPKNLLLDLIETPEVQRLRRIRQLGLGHLVFPGAEHTRFNHALGAMALMQEALANLSEKGTPISTEEHLAACAAALLHDIGHGPFSHTLEHQLIEGFTHEAMSRVLLLRLNERFNGALELTIQIFDDVYARPFFHQLVSSQLDMDRLDYLRRDSFYTGVVEGKVGVERIIKTLRVHPIEGGPDSRIVIESKGIYAVENFLIARRLMYWQVYLHKTVLAADALLRAIIRRARILIQVGDAQTAASCAPALCFFLERPLKAPEAFTSNEVIENFCQLDDVDVLYSIKQWSRARDAILADLSRRFLHRQFFRTTFLPEAPSPAQLAQWRQRVAQWLVQQGIVPYAQAEEAATYYLTADASQHTAYEPVSDPIPVLDRNDQIRELSRTADAPAIDAIARFVIKPYLCLPKELPLELP
jgi:HD superfamily phosphohydrolase